MRIPVALLLALGAAIPRAAAEPLVLGGQALVREDEGRRVVVVIDVDRDAKADHLFILDPQTAPARPVGPFEGRVDLVFEEGTFRLDAADGRVRLRMAVREVPEDVPPVAESGGVLVMYGRAIQHRTYSGGPALRDVDTRDMVTVSEEGCGETDADCQSGGRLASNCSVTCLGGAGHGASFGVAFTGQACSVSCLPGAYGCCSCKAMRQTPECSCRATASLKPCEPAPTPAPTRPPE